MMQLVLFIILLAGVSSNLFEEITNGTSINDLFKRNKILTNGIEDNAIMKSYGSETVTKIIQGKSEQIKECSSHPPFPESYRHKRCPHCTKTIIWLDLSDETCFHVSSCSKKTSFGTFCNQCEPKSDCKRGMHLLDDFSCQDVSSTINQHLINNDEPEFCSIGEMKIRDCSESVQSIEDVSWVLINRKVHFVKDLRLKRDEEPNQLNSYSCMNGTKSDIKNGQCSGDESYCKNFGCIGAIKCNCQIKPKPGTVYHHIEEDRIGIDCWGVSSFRVTKKLFNPKQVKPNCPNCDIVRSHKGFIIHTRGKIIRFFQCCLPPHCISGSSDSSSLEITLTDEMRLSTAKANIELWLERETEPVRIETFRQPDSVCDIIDCFMCVIRWANYQCFSWVQWVCISIFVSLLTIILALFIWAIGTLYRSIRYIVHPFFNGIYQGFRLLFIMIRAMFRKLLKKVKTAADEDQESVPLTGIEVRGRNRFKELTYRGNTDNSNQIMSRDMRGKRLAGLTVFGLLTLLGNCSACSLTQVFSISAPSCSYSSGSVSSCEVSHYTRLSVSPIGQTSCFIMKDPNNLSIGSIQVRTDNIHLVCQKNLMYYTFNSKGEFSTIHECWNYPNCIADKCEKASSSDLLGGLFKGKNLGWTRCDRSCGCVTCGCARCESSCIWTRSYITNKDADVYEVSECSQWVYELELTITKVTLADQSTKKVTLSPGKSIKIFGVEFSIISISIPAQPILNKCFMRSKIGTAVVDCNRKGELSKGKVGEIQCPSEISAMGSTQDCFSNPGIFSIRPQADTSSVVLESIDIKNLLLDNLLPKTVGSSVLIVREEKVTAVVNSVGLFEIQMKMEEFKLIGKTDNNKCFSSFVSLTGCYSCSVGATLSLKVNTDFGSTTALIECDDSFTSTFNVKNVPSIVNVTFISQKSNVKETCYVICPGGKTSLDIKGSLIYYEVKNYQSTDRIVGHQILSNSTYQWEGLTSSSWFKWILGSFGFLMIAAGLVGFVIFIIYIKR